MVSPSQAAQARYKAESRMTDRCTIAPEKSTVDPATLASVPTAGTAQYTGKCRLSSRSVAITDRSAAGQAFSDSSLILFVPVGAASLIRKEAIVTVTAVDPDFGDPSIVGKRFRIAGRVSGSQAASARFSVVSL